MYVDFLTAMIGLISTIFSHQSDERETGQCEA